MEIATLDLDAIDELAAFAARLEVVRFGDHPDTDPRARWEAWLGPRHPNRGFALAGARCDDLRMTRVRPHA